MQKDAKKSEKKRKKLKNRLEFRFALFASKQKLLNRREGKNLKRKKCEKMRKKRKKVKKSEKSKKIDLNFASLCFPSKRKFLK